MTRPDETLPPTPVGLEVKAGDIFFTRGTSGLSRLIQWAEQYPGEEPTWANHVGTVVKSGWLVPEIINGTRTSPHLAETVEALWRVEHTKWWDRHRYETGYEVEVWRHTEETEEQIRAEVQMLLRRVGDRYAWWRLPIIGLRRLTKGKVDLTGFFLLEDRNICSTLVATCKAVAAQILFGCGPRRATPDGMHDYVKAHRVLSLEQPGPWSFVGRRVIGDRRRRGRGRRETAPAAV